jgi:hypothetical protein
MKTQAHYDNHLAGFYSWMTGDFEQKTREFETFLQVNDLSPSHSGIAIDLGCGHGIQSVALARSGYGVKAIDFSGQLLEELLSHAGSLPIEPTKADLTELDSYASLHPELIVCCGDTLTHLESRASILQLLHDVSGLLGIGGKLVLSFRDYSDELSGDSRFIPVKSDDDRILTCFLEYQTDHVLVTDLLHERTADGWQQRVSSYMKVRIAPEDVIAQLEELGMKVVFREPVNRLFTIIAIKPAG